MSINDIWYSATAICDLQTPVVFTGDQVTGLLLHDLLPMFIIEEHIKTQKFS